LAVGGNHALVHRHKKAVGNLAFVKALNSFEALTLLAQLSVTMAYMQSLSRIPAIFVAFGALLSACGGNRGDTARSRCDAEVRRDFGEGYTADEKSMRGTMVGKCVKRS